MLRFLRTTESQARDNNGQPAQSTAGVANKSSSHRADWPMVVCDGIVLDEIRYEDGAVFVVGTFITLEHWDRFDDLVASLARNWKLDRMATIDRNILRLGCYELACHPDVPAGAVINEAVELAKKFGSNQSSAFVNGILDRVRERRDEGHVLLPEPATTDTLDADTPDTAPREL